MYLYRVTDYGNIDKWCLRSSTAADAYDEALYGRSQEKSEMLHVRRYKTPLTVSELLEKALNNDMSWADQCNNQIIRQANPTVKL